MIPEERLVESVDFWKRLTRKFACLNDIPDIPAYPKAFMIQIVCPKLISCGAIPKSKLSVGRVYLGKSLNKNINKAIWTGKEFWTGKDFFYKRNKLGIATNGRINHFEDDNGDDIFIPIKDITNES